MFVIICGYQIYLPKIWTRLVKLLLWMRSLSFICVLLNQTSSDFKEQRCTCLSVGEGQKCGLACMQWNALFWLACQNQSLESWVEVLLLGQDVITPNKSVPRFADSPLVLMYLVNGPFSFHFNLWINVGHNILDWRF